MATGITTTEDIDAILPTLIAPARDVIEKPTFMMEMVSQATLGDGEGDTYNWPKFDHPLEAQALQEGVPINNPQKLIPSIQSWTVSEVGIEIILTDRANRRTPEAMKARAGRFAGNAIKRRREQDLLGLIPGFSRDLGTAGSAFNPNTISVARVRLDTAAGVGADAAATEAAPWPYAAVLHPFHYHDLGVSAATLGSNINSTSGYFPIEGITEEFIKKYQLNTLYGVALTTSSLIPIDGSDDAVSGVFSKESLLYIKTSLNMKTEYERDIHLRAWDMVLTSEWGSGEINDTWGFKITADASLPTS